MSNILMYEVLMNENIHFWLLIYVVKINLVSNAGADSDYCWGNFQCLIATNRFFPKTDSN